MVRDLFRGLRVNHLKIILVFMPSRRQTSTEYEAMISLARRRAHK